MRKSTIPLLIIIFVLVGGAIWYGVQNGLLNYGNRFGASAYFACDDGKGMDTAFYSDKVILTLDDGRLVTLPGTTSESGKKYANEDGSAVFFSKGNIAYLEEGGRRTFSGCIPISSKSTDLSGIFASSNLGFSFRYSVGWPIDTSYQYEGLGEGKEIKGVALIIPENYASGTNLSKFDTGVRIESLPLIGGENDSCTADRFLYEASMVEEKRIDGIKYSVAESSGVGAGNFYEETVYAIPGTNPCIAVRYFIHSMNIGNYPEGTVREFDRKDLISKFNEIRDSLVVGQ